MKGKDKVLEGREEERKEEVEKRRERERERERDYITQDKNKHD